MSEITKTMDSVFDDCVEDELDFDVIFDQDDSIIDTVNGVNEAGDPLTGVDFPELHQTEDEDITPDDIRDELGTGHDERFGASNPEGSKKAEQEDYSAKDDIDKRLDSDKFYDGTEDDYHKDTRGPKPDEDSVQSSIEKVIESYDDIDDVLDGDDDEDITESFNDIDDILDGVGGFTESSKSGADKDVEKIVKDEEDPENDDIDSILDSKDNKKTSKKLEYDISDEELIDMAINGDK